MMHDFGVTATRVVFLDLPVVFDLALAAGRPVHPLPLDARGRRPGRGDAADRRQRPTSAGSASIPIYVFHVAQLLRRRRPHGASTSSATTRHSTPAPARPSACVLPVLARWTVDPAANRVTEQRLDDIPVEFPRIDDAVAGRPHRYGYCARLGDRARPARLRGTDQVRPGPRRVHPLRPGRAPSRPGSRSSSRPPTAGGRTRAGSSRSSTTPPGTPATWSSSTPPRSPDHRWPRCTCRPGSRSDSTARGCPSDS